MRRVLLMSISMLLLLPTGAKAAVAPPCTSEQFSAADATFARGLVFRPDLELPRDVYADSKQTETVYTNVAETPKPVSTDDDSVLQLLLVSGSPPAYPYRQAFSADPNGFGDDAPLYTQVFPEVPLQLSLADGPAVYAFTYTRTAGGVPCRATVFSGLLTPVARPVLDAGLKTATVQMQKPADKLFVPVRISGCVDQQLSLRVTFAGRRVTTTEGLCKVVNDVDEGGLGVHVEGLGRQRAYRISISRRKTFKGTVTYQLLADGKPVASGSFQVKGTVTPGTPDHDIYDTDFDRFVNVCINENYMTYAKGGHLYCTVPGLLPRYRQRISRVSRPR